MARGDIISDWDVTIAATTTISVQPASGVEWLVTEIYSTEGVDSGVQLYPTTDNDSLKMAYPGSTSFSAAVHIQLFGVVSRKWFLTNAQYLRIRNAEVNEETFIYSGLQTK